MFAYYFPPGIYTGAKRPFRFAKHLRQCGYTAHVITADEQTDAAPWKHATQTPGECVSRPARAGSAGAALLQRFLPYNDQLPWVAHAVSAAIPAIASSQSSVILSTSPPVACHVAALITKRRTGLPWVADFRDSVYGNPSRTRKWGWLWDKPVDYLIAAEADAIIANTDTAGEMLRRRYPQFASKVFVIWNGFDPDSALTARPIPSRKHRVIVHAGSIYGQRHPSALLASLDRLFTKGEMSPEQIRLRLIGHFYPDEPWVTQSKFHKLLERGCVEYTEDLISPECAAEEIAQADYLLLLDINDRQAGLQVPGKLFEYIQIGRPVIAFTARNSLSERILSKSGVRSVCIYPDMSEDQVDHCIRSALNMPTEPLASSEWFQHTFNGRLQAEALAAILDKVAFNTRNVSIQNLKIQACLYDGDL
jgi:glycosyltransferase involved in cell wall biosynthesis